MRRLFPTFIKGCLIALPALVWACGGDSSSSSPGAGGSAGIGTGGVSPGGKGNGGTGATVAAGATGGAGAISATGGSGGSQAGGGGGQASGGAGGSPPGSFNCEPPTGPTPVLTLTEVATGFSRPLLATSPPQDPRLFVVEQGGVVHIVSGGATLPTPFLDLSALVTRNGNEQGLLGLAFHPDYAQNGRLFVHYSTQADANAGLNEGDTVIAEYRVSSADPNVANATPTGIILTEAQPESNHNGGSIEFGLDGMLYIGLGDGGGAGDNHGTIGHGQDTSTRLGALLRVDVDTPAGGNNYGIPAGNMSGASVAPELFAYGLRNPYRFNFDPCTGDAYIADVGQSELEEIDVLPPGVSGRNYGWRLMEGTACYNPSSNCDPNNATILPVAEYDHTLGCSVTGGYVYRGTAIPGLRGSYLYADFCTGNFWALEYSAGQASNVRLITDSINPGLSINNISSFGQDGSGELYVLSFNGSVYRIDAQ